MAEILIIDDEETIVEILQDILTEEGHEVYPFSSSVQAVHYMKDLSPDVVITDIYMPDCDGFEVLMKLRKTCPTIKTIVISGGNPAMPNVTSMAEKLGAVASLKKPFSRDEVIATVNSVL